METEIRQNTADLEVSLRKLLAEKLAYYKIKNSSYSVRAFAKKLGISPAALSQILNGKRALTKKTAQKMISRLHLDPKEHQKYLDKLGIVKRLGKSKKNYVQLQMDQYHMISDWYYFGILSLSETDDFISQPAWIAKRLGIKIIEAEKALRVLERLKLLRRNDQNELEYAGFSFRTSTDVPNIFLQKSHNDNLELAKNSLESDPIQLRDFSSMTMAIDPDLLPQAKELIRQFRRSLSEFLESGEKKEVYKLNLQIFPLSHHKEQK